MIPIPVITLPHGADMDLPSYATEHAAGLDLMAAVAEPMAIEPGQWTMVPTGIAMALPVGYEAQVRPRSGLAAKHGVTVLNSPGTIDADYRGEIKVILINHGNSTYAVEPKSRIAQLVIAPITQISWEIAESLPETTRGDGGFGSTGTGKTGV
ncbi:MAG TPA: dUTP diphosphatase [Alphaproteobacteria bacterium]|jgi:dUTP pyrophosphatase|nr:dUTP diphosphatase [Alphaproteobacteria bacterium]